MDLLAKGWLSRGVVGCALLVVSCLNGFAFAEVYRWVDDAGKVHFSDKPPESSVAEEINLKVNSYTSTYVEENETGDTKKVVMYSAVWCGVCKKAKKYFTKNNIPFVEYDIETSSKGRRDYKKLNGNGVPIILVGDKRMNGFSASSFNKIYQQ